MRTLLAVLLIMATPVWSFEEDPNWYIKHCMKLIGFEQTQDWMKLSACTGNFVNKRQNDQHQELRAFIKANPRYRYPGQSLNRCFGKPREMPFESAGIETNGNSMRAWVNYKDKLPAGCYENAPWDNRYD